MPFTPPLLAIAKPPVSPISSQQPAGQGQPIREYKLSSLLQSPVSQEDRGELIKWLEKNAAQLRHVTLIFDHSDDNSNKQILIRLSKKASNLIFINETIKLNSFHQEFTCVGTSVVANTIQFLQVSNNNFTKITFEVKDVDLQIPVTLINNKHIGELRSKEFFLKNNDKSIDIYPDMLITKILELITQLKTWAKHINLPDLKLTKEECQKLLDLVETIPKCLFNIKEICVFDQDIGFNQKLITNVKKGNWAQVSRRYDSSPYYSYSSYTPPKNDISSALAKLSQRNQLLTQMQENKIIDKEGKLNLADYLFIEEHLEQIVQYIAAQSHYKEIDLSSNIFKPCTVLDMLLRISHNRAFKLILNRCTFHFENSNITLVDALIDKSNIIILKSLSESRLSVSKFILTQPNDVTQANNVSLTALLPLIIAYQHINYEIVNFSSNNVTESDKKKLATDLNRLESITIQNMPTFTYDPVTVLTPISKEAYTVNNDLRCLLLRIARRNLILKAMTTNKLLAEFANLLHDTDSDKKRNKLNLSRLFIDSSHMESIKRYILSFRDYLVIDLDGNDLTFSEILDLTAVALTHEKSIKLICNGFYIDINKGTLNSIVIQASQLESILRWWQNNALATDKFKLVINLDMNIDVQKVNALLELSQVSTFTLTADSIDWMAQDFWQLCQALLKLGVSSEIKSKNYSCKLDHNEISEIALYDSLMPIFLILIENGCPVSKVDILSLPSDEQLRDYLLPFVQYQQKIKHKSQLTVTKVFVADISACESTQVTVDTRFTLQFYNIFIKHTLPFQQLIIRGSLLHEINESEKALHLLTRIIIEKQTTSSFTLIPHTVGERYDEYTYSKISIEEKITLHEDDVAHLATCLSNLTKLKYGQLTETDDVAFSRKKNEFQNALLTIVRRNRIMQALKENKSLSALQTLTKEEDSHTLNLNYLLLTFKQVPIILDYLKHHEEIQKLYLTGNPLLAGAGLIELLEGLKTTPWVIQLDLEFINFGIDVIQKLRAYLQKNYLLFLYISNNQLKDPELTEIKNIIHENRSLILLDIRNNLFTATNNQLLARALCENRCLTEFNFDTSSEEAHIDIFFKELGWIKKRKASQATTSRLQSITIFSTQLQEAITTVQRHNGRGLDPASKQVKSLGETSQKYLDIGKAQQSSLTAELIDVARNGKDLAKFKKLLDQASPYTDAEHDGYLQHIVVSCGHEQFLSYLFDNFQINPWLRFQGKTIMDIANEKNLISLKSLISVYMDKLKAQKQNISISSTPAPASNPVKQTTLSNLSAAKKHKAQHVKEEKNITDISAPHPAAGISQNNAVASSVAATPSLPSVQPMHVDTQQIQRAHSLPIAPPPPLAQSVIPAFSEHMKILLITQAIQTQQIELLKTYWHVNLRETFIQTIKLTPLQYVLHVKAITCIETLILAGENIDETDSVGLPLIYQLISNFLEEKNTVEFVDVQIALLQKLIDCKAQVDNKVTDHDRHQNTITHKAAQMRNYRCLKILLKHPRCPLNEKNSLQRTPLIEAVEINHAKMVARLLLDRRHSRATILTAATRAAELGFNNIKQSCHDHLTQFNVDIRSSGMQWSRSLTVQFSKPSRGNSPVHAVNLDKEHAWLQMQNQFTQQCMTITDPIERSNKLSGLGNPVTASLTFVLTTSVYTPHSQQHYIDITVPLKNIAEYHLTQAFADQISDAERQAVVSKEDIMNVLPHYQNFRHGHKARTRADIATTHNNDFAQTFRHGERSLLTYLAQESNIKNIIISLLQQPGFVPQAKCIGVILNVASPRYACENCETALLATQNPTLSTFLPLLTAELTRAQIRIPRFSPMRMVTCISSFIPFNTDCIPANGHQLLTIDFRQNDVLLSKDFSQVTETKPHTQFRSNKIS